MAKKKTKSDKAKNPSTSSGSKASKKKKSEKSPQQKQGKKTPDNHVIIKKTDSKKALWYVVHTYSGHEHKVAQTLKQRVETMSLQDKVFEIFIPTQSKIQIKQGKKEKVKEKIFPGYIMVKMILTDEAWLAVRTTQGITSFVGAGNKPTPLPKSEVESILKFSQMEAPKYKAAFTIGEAVKIIEGPFADFLGTVDHIDEAKGKVRVLVSIFGRETPVELDFLQVQKI